MEFAVIIIGLMLISSGFKGTEHELGTRLQSDLTGTDGFIIWVAALGALFAISKIPGFATPVKWLYALLFVVVIIGNPTFFSSLVSAFSDADSAGPAPSIAINTGSSSSSSGGSSEAGSLLGTAVKLGAAYETGGASLAVTGA